MAGLELLVEHLTDNGKNAARMLRNAENSLAAARAAAPPTSAPPPQQLEVAEQPPASTAPLTGEEDQVKMRAKLAVHVKAKSQVAAERARASGAARRSSSIHLSRAVRSQPVGPAARTNLLRSWNAAKVPQRDPAAPTPRAHGTRRPSFFQEADLTSASAPSSSSAGELKTCVARTS